LAVAENVADVVGLLASATLTVLALNVVPGLHVDPRLQFCAVVAVGFINLLAWARAKVRPVSLTKGLKLLALCTMILVAMAAIDTAVGLVGERERTIPEAFFNSGPLGGIVDAILFVCGLFVGVPTLTRAICMYYNGHGSDNTHTRGE
jgi:hypothetical protein